MLIIKHRVNSLESLVSLSSDFGVEVDLHFNDSSICVGHDPFDLDTTFDDYLDNFHHRFLAVNIKEEGIESMVFDSLKKHRIDQFFLFDLSFPSLMRIVRTGERRMALRMSDFERIENVAHFQDKVDWIWLDTFQTTNHLSDSFFNILANFQICVVSPELHVDRDEVHSIKIRDALLQFKDSFQAVCTKNEQLWQK